jgi:2-aminoethylphosphonate-pyruvate transaminase
MTAMRRSRATDPQAELTEVQPDSLSESHDPYLLTPGPLTTSLRTKKAMLHDWGSWDAEFNEVTADIRRRLIAMVGGGEAYDCVPIQGSGTYCVEAMLSSFIPRDGRALVLMNGAYGKRAATTLQYLGREFIKLDKGDYQPPMPEEVDELLTRHPEITDVIAIHCETSSGILNPLKGISDVVMKHGRRLLVDAMSAFGAVPLDVAEVPFEVMVSSANKCIEGVPGFGFLIAKKTALEQAEGRSHSLSLDVHDQWASMNETGMWRFTPPTHAVVAFHEALLQHEEEGGAPGRLARYTRNRDVMVKGMREIGFSTLLDDEWLSPIITTFFCPADPKFTFKRFYDELKARNFIIYPGKLTEAESFRIGCIGQLDEGVMRQLLTAVRETLEVMGVKDCGPPQTG